MLPELAAIYGVGMLPPLLVGVVQRVRALRKRKSKQFLQVQKNLRSVNLFWSAVEDNIKKYSEEQELKEARKESATFRVITISAIFLSWPGLFLLLVIFLSPSSRLQKRVFESVLSEKDLSAQEVRLHLKAVAEEQNLEPWI